MRLGVSNTLAYYSNYSIAGVESFIGHVVGYSLLFFYQLKQLTRARCLLADNPMDCSSKLFTAVNTSKQSVIPTLV